VKNANPSMSVCEVGASIGRLWREMSDADKQQYNDDFSREKVESAVLHECEILQQVPLFKGLSITAVTCFNEQIQKCCDW